MDKEGFINFVENYAKNKMLTALMERNYLIWEDNLTQCTESYYVFIHNYFYYVMKQMLNEDLKANKNNILIPFEKHPEKNNIHKYFVGVVGDRHTINAYTYIDKNPNCFIHIKNNNFYLPAYYFKSDLDLLLQEESKKRSEIEVLNDYIENLFKNIYGEEHLFFERRIKNKYMKLQLNPSLSILDVLPELIQYKN